MRTCLLIGAIALGLIAWATPADASGVRMFVRHEVSDYATWRKAYEGFKPTQARMGVVHQAVYQSSDNPNDITVVHDFKSEEKAKAFAASAELKTAMQSAGVKGAPQVWFAKATPGSSGQPSRVRMFVRHEVADYAKWRKGYDEYRPTAKNMGVTAQAVYQSTDNPNDVTVCSDFQSSEKAQAFAASADLKTAMQNAGVKGAPQIWLTARALK